MEKNIKDYLHFYLGCDCLVQYRDNYVDTANETMPALAGYVKLSFEETKKETLTAFILSFYKPEYIKPILRQLSSITENEKNELELFQFENMKNGLNQVERCASITKWYLDRHFDLFGLIDAGLAIDEANQYKSTDYGNKDNNI